MDIFSQNLLNHIQTDFPLVEKPFEQLAKMFSATETQVISTIKDLKQEQGLIRTISAIFDGKKLGYQSALIAFNITDQYLPSLIEELDLHSGVSHNYSRKNHYNLWFTIALQDNEDIELEVSKLASKYNVNSYLILPSIKTYKLKVDFTLGDKKNLNQNKSINSIHDQNIVIKTKDKQIIKQLQAELSLVSRPFDLLANEIGLSIGEFLEKANFYNRTGIMRRYCATLRHHKAGYKFNAMAVWHVDPSLIDNVGARVARCTFVSHCYQRKTYHSWPYNFFTMVHATTKEELQIYIEELKQIIYPSVYDVLETLKEHKKTRVQYFK